MSKKLVKDLGEGGKGLTLFGSNGTSGLYDVLHGVITTVNALAVAYSDLATKYNAARALYNAHTHGCNGAEVGDYNCSAPVTTAQSAGAAPGEAVSVFAAATAASVTTSVTIE